MTGQADKKEKREGRNRWPRAPEIPVQRICGIWWRFRGAVGQELNITTQSSSLPHGLRELELVGERLSREIKWGN